MKEGSAVGKTNKTPFFQKEAHFDELFFDPIKKDGAKTIRFAEKSSKRKIAVLGDLSDFFISSFRLPPDRGPTAVGDPRRRSAEPDKPDTTD